MSIARSIAFIDTRVAGLQVQVHGETSSKSHG